MTITGDLKRLRADVRYAASGATLVLDECGGLPPRIEVALTEADLEALLEGVRTLRAAAPVAPQREAAGLAELDGVPGALVPAAAPGGEG
ncbi:hypothetical protein [Gemmata sp.]|uniref:hypothetical protein n=1 Tax=Gemmata sp. TaxID=1914242 RepID=UPI003F716ABD